MRFTSTNMYYLVFRLILVQFFVEDVTEDILWAESKGIDTNDCYLFYFISRNVKINKIIYFSFGFFFLKSKVYNYNLTLYPTFRPKFLWKPVDVLVKCFVK